MAARSTVAVASSTMASAWSPLREPLFRWLWIAAVISFTGSWMQIVGAGWLMTSLTAGRPDAPLLVGLVQAANALPVFLVALPAGALADMVDRRRLLIGAQLWMVAVAAALGVLTLFSMVTPWMLLAFTFLLGFGAVMNDPAWQAIAPEVVSGGRFAAAVALNSAGFNVARAAGPALGGLVIAAAGEGPAFLINAASFFGVILFLHRWRRPPTGKEVPARQVMQALRAGVAYAADSVAVRSVLLRTGAFSLFASALWAMLPLVTRRFGSVGYGVALGCLGAGAVVGAALLPALRRHLDPNALVAVAMTAFAIVTVAAGRVEPFWLLCVVLAGGGVAWIAILASLNLAAQTMSPGWVRARSLSMYLLVLQGGMAAGGALWGAVAGEVGVPNALSFAAAGLVLGLALVHRRRLQVGTLDVETLPT